MKERHDGRPVGGPLMDRRHFLHRAGVGGSVIAAGLLATDGVLAPDGALAAHRQVTSIHQTAVYQGATPQDLYDVYTTAATHSEATHPASGEVRWVDPRTGEEHPSAAEGLVLEGFPLPDGSPGLTAPVVELVPGRKIVQRWITFAWQLAQNRPPSTVPSTLKLEFRANTAGAEVVLTQRGLPTYEIDLTPSPFNPSGEQGPLSEIVRVHWELFYWQPIRRYLSAS